LKLNYNVRHCEIHNFIHSALWDTKLYSFDCIKSEAKEISKIFFYRSISLYDTNACIARQRISVPIIWELGPWTLDLGKEQPQLPVYRYTNNISNMIRILNSQNSKIQYAQIFKIIYVKKNLLLIYATLVRPFIFFVCRKFGRLLLIVSV
jgi:hypothetical protein